MKFNEYMKIPENRIDEVLLKKIKCLDGVEISVQASHCHYCSPKVSGADLYTKVEVGYPTIADETLLPYAEYKDTPTNTVYGYVPVEIVDAFIEAHGGIATT